MMVPQHKLEIWPGHVVRVQDMDGGLMLLCDTAHKVLRSGNFPRVQGYIFSIITLGGVGENMEIQAREKNMMKKCNPQEQNYYFFLGARPPKKNKKTGGQKCFSIEGVGKK